MRPDRAARDAEAGQTRRVSDVLYMQLALS